MDLIVHGCAEVFDSIHYSPVSPTLLEIAYETEGIGGLLLVSALFGSAYGDVGGLRG